MTTAGIQWSAAAHVHYSTGTDIDGIAVADAAGITTDEISGADKLSTEISIIAVEDNTGAIDGDVIIDVLRSDNDEDSEGWSNSTDENMQFRFTPTQNDTERFSFTLYHDTISDFKLYIYNDAGQELAITVNQRQSTLVSA